MAIADPPTHAALIEAWARAVEAVEVATAEERRTSHENTAARNVLSAAQKGEREAFDAIEKYRISKRLAAPSGRPIRDNPQA